MVLEERGVLVPELILGPLETTCKSLRERSLAKPSSRLHQAADQQFEMLQAAEVASLLATRGQAKTGRFPAPPACDRLDEAKSRHCRPISGHQEPVCRTRALLHSCSSPSAQHFEIIPQNQAIELVEQDMAVAREQPIEPGCSIVGYRPRCSPWPLAAPGQP